MANPEHVEIVKKGAEAIAGWRDEHPDERLDLRGAELGSLYPGERLNLRKPDLHEADLHEAWLSGAQLQGTKLSGANLSQANLSQARLTGADLHQADLSGAQLHGADLRFADLSEADMSGGTLNYVNLTGAVLRGANLTKVNVWQTTFGDVDLSEVRGLESEVRMGPCTIGVDTLLRSKGKIPDVFLRGCGVPDALIEYLPGLIASMEPIQFYSCFVSYNSADEQFARRLHARLTAEKLRVWFAPEAMRGGRKSAVQIDEAIRVYDRLLLVLSKNSMESEWVRREIKRAREKERRTKSNVLFPIALVSFEEIRAWECLDSDTGEDLAEKVREYHIPDFTRWKQEDEFEKAFAELMRDLRAEDEGGRMKAEG